VSFEAAVYSFGALALAALLALAWYAAHLRAACARLRHERDDAVERHRHVLDAAADGVYVVDERETITHLNAQAERLLRAHAGALVGRALDEILDPLASELLPDVRYARRTGETLERTQTSALAGTAIRLRVRPAGSEVIVSLRDAGEHACDGRDEALVSRPRAAAGRT
jgi:PAS domain-containing protein